MVWGISMFQNNKFFKSILFRISVWFLLMGIVGVTAVSYSMEIQMRLNTEKQITEELLRVKENAQLYVCQVLMLHDNQINKEGFEKFINDIEEQFQNAGYRNVAFYDIEGKPIGTGNERFVGLKNREDFGRAMNGESAFTLHYGKDNACDVYFSMPAKARGELLGHIRFYLDYNEIYERERNALHSMIYGIILVLGVSYIIIWLIVNRMVKPIRRLADISEDISSHFEDGRLDTKLLGEEQFYRRQDEIGELAGNYKKMLTVTKEQFEKIEQDRKRILSLLDSRQEFYNSITHELKTPLAVISGYAQLIGENGLADTELFHRGMAQILRESERMHRMVVQLLDMQDMEGEYTLEPIEMIGVLMDVTEMMRMKAKRYDNTITLHIEEGEYIMNGREDRIRQVLINLIDNAIKYGEMGKEIRIQMKTEDEMIKVDVVNHGEGLNKQELERIFEPFYRVDKERSRELGSAGLGLSIVRKIVNEHNGRIVTECIPGEYTVFSVFFPRVDEEAFTLDRHHRPDEERGVDRE